MFTSLLCYSLLCFSCSHISSVRTWLHYLQILQIQILETCAAIQELSFRYCYWGARESICFSCSCCFSCIFSQSVFGVNYFCFLKYWNTEIIICSSCLPSGVYFVVGFLLQTLIMITLLFVFFLFICPGVRSWADGSPCCSGLLQSLPVWDL